MCVIVKCPNCDGRLHRAKAPTGSFKKLNGTRWPRYYHYKCDKCHQLWHWDEDRSLYEREK